MWFVREEEYWYIFIGLKRNKLKDEGSIEMLELFEELFSLAFARVEINEFP